MFSNIFVLCVLGGWDDVEMKGWVLSPGMCVCVMKRGLEMESEGGDQIKKYQHRVET